ncbi:uncharacterized protein [Procambarus clarkii]|uniref:uncharacterized protein n=1 Tax=Procambarus clarkii TaxID=6728 RepID=UPI0037448781
MRRPGLVSCGSGLTTQLQFLHSADPVNCERCQRSPWGTSLSTSLSARGTPHQPHVSRQQHLLNLSPATGLGQNNLLSSSRQHLHLTCRSHDEAVAALSSIVCDCCCGNNFSAHTLPLILQSSGEQILHANCTYYQEEEDPRFGHGR